MPRHPTPRQINSFMEKAKRFGYDAEVSSLKEKARPGTDILQYPRGRSPRTSAWFWEDIWVGSNPFSGVTTIWYKARPCWQTHYWGYVVQSESSKRVYKFLRWARRQRWQKKSSRTVSGGKEFPSLKYTVSETALTREFFSTKKHEVIHLHRKVISEVIEIRGVCR